MSNPVESYVEQQRVPPSEHGSLQAPSQESAYPNSLEKRLSVSTTLVGGSYATNSLSSEIELPIGCWRSFRRRAKNVILGLCCGSKHDATPPWEEAPTPDPRTFVIRGQTFVWPSQLELSKKEQIY